MKKMITIYSCSGCSNLAQLANAVAVKMHRDKIAVMSCIAGVGGDVAQLVKMANEAEKILAIDGCPLACAQKCLERHYLQADAHIILTELSLSKNIFGEATDEEFEIAYQHVLHKLNQLKESEDE